MHGRRPQDRSAARTRRTIALLPVLVRREIRAKYRTSALDIAWAVLTPIALLAVYGVVLTRSFDVQSSCSPYLSSAWAGLVVWTTFSTAVGGGVTSLVSQGSLITKIAFPLESVPLAQVGVSFIDLGVGALLFVGVAVVQGVSFGAASAWVVLPVLVLVVWSALLSVFTAVLAAFVRDSVHLVMLVLRVGFFATPVMYESSFLPGPFQWSAEVNPLAVAIDGVRASVLCNARPAVLHLLVHLAVGLVGLLLAVRYTQAVESRVVDVV